MDMEITPLVGEIDLTYFQVTPKFFEYYVFDAVCHCSEHDMQKIMARNKDHFVLRDNPERNFIDSIMNLPILKGPQAIREYAIKVPEIRIAEDIYGFRVPTDDHIAYVRCQPYDTINNIHIVGYTPDIEKVAKPMRINYMIEHPDETLPEFCYTTLPDTGEWVIVNRGESGYQLHERSTSDPKFNRETAKQYNKGWCISDEQEEAMVIGAMGKWKERERDNVIEDMER